MIFSSSIPEILSDEPFKNDLLNREQYADILTSLISVRMRTATDRLVKTEQFMQKTTTKKVLI